MEGHYEGVSLSGHLIPIVMRDLGSHDAIVDGRRNLHHLQAMQLGQSNNEGLQKLLLERYLGMALPGHHNYRLCARDTVQMRM